MSLLPQFAALAALLPAMTAAPVPLDGTAGGITLALCAGGSITIPANGPDSPARGGTAPCCAKGCHGSERKRKIDGGQ